MEKEKIKAIFLGVDVGNGYTKARKIKFASKVKPGQKVHLAGKKKKDIYDTEFNGVKYIVGEGVIFTGPQRYFGVEYKLCLLTAIALNFPKEDFIKGPFCVGLPVELYKLHGEKLIEEFKGKQFVIKVEDREVTIRFEDFDVFVEGAYPIITQDNERVITIDMGAGTVNVTQFNEQNIEKYATYDESMYKMYGDIAQYLNTQKGARFMPNQVEPLIHKKTTWINQEEVDITDIQPIIEANIRNVSSQIQNTFDVSETSKIYLIGGGAMDTVKYWSKFFLKIKPIEDGQAINSQVFDLVAADLAEGDDEE